MVFPSNFWIQNFKVVVFPSNFWKTTIICQFCRVILTFAQECYYLKTKVGVVDFTKACGVVKFQSPRALQALGHLKNLLLPLYFWGNVSLLPWLPKQSKRPKQYLMFSNLNYRLPIYKTGAIVPIAILFVERPYIFSRYI